MKNWKAHNSKVFKKHLEEYKDSIKEELKAVLFEVASSIRDLIEDRQGLPFFTGNLSDSTGIGVYIDGVLIEYVPSQAAVEPQKYFGEEVWGADELQEALELNGKAFSQGLWIVAFSAVPYAASMNIYSDPPYFDSVVVEAMVHEFFEKATPVLVNTTAKYSVETPDPF
jgi:hypothetical protein